MRIVAALLVLPALAGCLVPDAATTSSVDASPLAGEAWDGATLQGRPRHISDLAGLATCLAAGTCSDPAAECTPTNCERRAFDVQVPDGFEGRLSVALRWPTDHSLWFLLRVEDPAGKVVAEGKYTHVDHLSSLALMDAPVSGTYTAEVILAVGGPSPYQGAWRLLPAAPPADGPVLPDLVTLTPTDLRIASPPFLTTAYLGLAPTGPLHPALAAIGAKGCGPEEAAEGARRCLRFSNAVGNVGDGPLDIRLAPGKDHFVQRVWHADGTHEDVAAGKAEFHAAHAHFHNAAASAFYVYEHDNATGERGTLVKEGRKTGICFADIGLVDLRHSRMEHPAHRGVECLNPARDKAWSMGLTPGWFDLYDWLVGDQYVSLAGVPDGTYELCSVANPEGTLLEADPTNNEACAVFELRGDDIEVLSAEPYHKSPE